MNIDTLKPLYNIEAVRKIEYYSETDSTNQRAKEDIRNIEKNEESENGSLELPCLYIADIQTAGRGRMGRPWKSDSGEGIWMSYSFRPKLAPDKIPGITLLASIAVARGISEYIKNKEPSFNVGEIKIKWPNDLVIGTKKVCGILTELVSSDDSYSVICGIGVNVNTPSFPGELQDKATSLLIETGKVCSRETLIYLIIRKLSELIEEYEISESLDFILEEYNSLLISMNKEVIIIDNSITNNNSTKKQSDYLNTFISRGINNTGALLIEDSSGNISSVSSGEVSVRGIYGYV